MYKHTHAYLITRSRRARGVPRSGRGRQTRSRGRRRAGAAGSAEAPRGSGAGGDPFASLGSERHEQTSPRPCLSARGCAESCPLTAAVWVPGRVGTGSLGLIPHTVPCPQQETTERSHQGNMAQAWRRPGLLGPPARGVSVGQWRWGWAVGETPVGAGWCTQRRGTRGLAGQDARISSLSGRDFHSFFFLRFIYLSLRVCV